MAKKTNKYMRLKGRMTQLGILQEDLAAFMKLSPAVISSRFTGRSDWRIEEMYHIMDIIKAPYSDLHLYFPRHGDDLKQPCAA